MKIRILSEKPCRAGQNIILACGGMESTLAAALAAERNLAFAAGEYLDAEDGTRMLQVLSALRLPVPPRGDAHPVPAEPAYLLHCLREIPASPPKRPVELELKHVRDGYSLAWITLSDKGARGERIDTAGPAIETSARNALPLSLAQGFLLPDDESALKGLLVSLALQDRFDLIVTTGGTGVGPRDRTPEATLAVIERRLGGFEAAMLAASARKTPHGMISRAVAGTLGQSLIVNLPGSPKAVTENLAAILPAVGHTLDKLRGDPADCGR